MVIQLEEEIKRQGRQRQWLAERMNISPSYLTRLLNGERVWSEELKAKACEALGLEVSPFLFAPDCRLDRHYMSDDSTNEAA